MNPRLIIFLAVAAIAGLWAFRRWRTAVRAALVLLVFEGALRKWVFPGAQELIYFAKDGLLVAAYAGFLADSGASRWTVRLPGLSALIGASAAVGALEIFNPHLPSILVGLLGFKAYFLYVPLLWVVPAAFRSREEVWRFLYSYSLLAIPLGLLALLQFASPASSMLNTYARISNPHAISTFGNDPHVRVTATFSYITGYVAYLFATTVMLLALLGAVRWRLRPYQLLYVSLGLSVLGILVSGSRSPMLMCALSLPVYWWLIAAKDRRNFEVISRAMVSIVVLGLFLSYAADDAVTAFFGRLTATRDFEERILDPFTQPYYLLPDAGATGYGIGATHQAAAALVEDAGPGEPWLPNLEVEAETGRVMVELGPFGFILFYALRITLIVMAFRWSIRLRDPFCRTLAVASLLFFLTHLPSGIVFNVTAGLYHWFFGGILFTAVRLDRDLAVGRDERASAAKAVTARARSLSPATGAAARNL